SGWAPYGAMRSSPSSACNPAKPGAVMPNSTAGTSERGAPRSPLGRPQLVTRLGATVRCGLEVHPAHVATRHGRALVFLLWAVGDDDLRREEESADGSGVLEGGAGHLGGVDDA